MTGDSTDTAACARQDNLVGSLCRSQKRFVCQSRAPMYQRQIAMKLAKTGCSMRILAGYGARSPQETETGELRMPMSQHRPALAAILVAFVAVLSLAAALPALAAPTTASPGAVLSQDALRYDGTWQGECWSLSRRWSSRPPDARSASTIARASSTRARLKSRSPTPGAGDIIQIADDNNTSPDADYPGLHTSIILCANGDGTFQIVDSNSNFDGIVHVREGYSPRSAATRYGGLTFHIYRISGSGPIAGPNTAAFREAPAHTSSPSTSCAETRRQSLHQHPGDVLRLRSAPNGAIITNLLHQTPVSIVALAGFANGYHWVHVSSPAGEGFVAAEFLARNTGPASPASGSATSTANDGSAPAAPSGSRSVNPVRPFRSFVPALTSED